MSSTYKTFYGFKKDPFSNDISIKDLIKLPGMVGVKERMDYTVDIGGVMVITGEIGSGKSTSIRWSTSQYHPSETKVLNVVANSASIIDMYKLIAWQLDLDPKMASRAKLVGELKACIRELVSQKKQKIILVIDEASLIRAEVFAELHTLTNFEFDSKNYLTTILCGQTILLDKLMYRSSMPLASRVVAKTHLPTLTRSQLEDYLLHHLSISGLKKQIFDETAINAIHQGANGILRKTNSLARGGLIAAAIENKNFVSAEHIRIAASELI